jgi:hypothetical protein
MLERAMSYASQVLGSRAGEPPATRARAAEDFAEAFPLRTWELDGEYPETAFRPHGYAWHHARGAVAGGARLVTVTGFWEDGRRGAVVLFHSDDGEWIVSARWQLPER